MANPDGTRDLVYVPATSESADVATHVLKHDDAFLVVDRHGDLGAELGPQTGLYDRDTRFLSRFVLRLNGARPLLLGSEMRDDDSALRVDLMNPELRAPGAPSLPRGTLHLQRTMVLVDGTCHQELRLHHYGTEPLPVTLELEVAADHADLFEVRGMARTRRGETLPPEVGDGWLRFGQVGLDERRRRTELRFDPAPEALDGSAARYALQLEPGAEVVLEVAVRCTSGSAGVRTAPAPPPRFAAARRRVRDVLAARRAEEVRVASSVPAFDGWLERALADLRMLRTDTPHGPYPYAGVPWFSAPFGRDGIITALEELWVDPDVARGTLRYLAATQADTDDPEIEAEPGKILHEARQGEMAAIGEVPFARYYGSMDATPLFVILAGAYHDAVADRAFAAEIWPHVERALSWMATWGDRDGDGFMEYVRRSSHGLPHQGWRDAHNAVFTHEGELAEGPIALAEVQGYAYAARLAAARLADALQQPARASELRDAAEVLRRRFDAGFWCEDRGSYALALDGSKQPCRVRASNAGHCLWTGIALPERAGRVADLLMDPASFSGWGIRTVAAGEALYSPIAYHNGTIWPHDSAIVGAGLARYGRRADAARLLTALYEASRSFPRGRLPELFCGFGREAGQPPTTYPVACSPQAWAAAAPFLLLQSCLGLELRGSTGTISFAGPLLPDGIDELDLRELRAGSARASVALRRDGEGVRVERLEGDARVEVAPIDA